MYLKKLNSSYTEYNNTYATQYAIGGLPQGAAKLLASALRAALTNEFPYFSITNINFHPQKEASKPFIGTLESLDQVIKTILELDFSFSLEFYRNMGLYNPSKDFFYNINKPFQTSLIKIKTLCSGKLQGVGKLYAKDLILLPGMKCHTPDRIIAHVGMHGFIGFTFEIGLFFGLNNTHIVEINSKSYPIKAHPILHIEIDVTNYPMFSLHGSKECIMLYMVTKGTINSEEIIQITSYMLLNKYLNLIYLFQQILN